MALALNRFKTVTKIATTSPVGIYTAPTGYTGVVLLAQAANIDEETYTVSFYHKRTVAGVAVTTEIVKDFAIQGNDAVSFLHGKLILQPGDTLILSSSDTSNSKIKFISSILETLN